MRFGVPLGKGLARPVPASLRPSYLLGNWEQRKILEAIDPGPEMGAFREHPGNPDSAGGQSSIDNLQIPGRCGDDTFGWSRLGIVIDILRGRKSIANLVEAVHQSGLL